MPEALTSQMNIRINALLKQRGDAAFTRLGYSASEVVRAVWALAASGQAGLAQLRDMLAQGSEIERGKRREEADAKGQGMGDGAFAPLDEPSLLPWELFDHYAAKLPHGAELAPSAHTDKELLEVAMVERMRERGLWE